MNPDDSDRCVVDFDHHSVEYAKDPEAVLRPIREQCPVAWSPNHGGFWVVTRAAEARQVMRDGLVFSSGRNSYGGEGIGKLIPKPPPMPMVVKPGELDGEEQLPYRRLFNQLLSPTHIETLKPMADKWVTHAIDAVIEQGECDLVDDLAVPIPAAIVTEWLGFPSGAWKAFARPIHDMAAFPEGSERYTQAMAGMQDLFGVLGEAIAERRARPRDDVITKLATFEVDGVEVDELSAIGMLWLMLLGGLDTTGLLIGASLVYLAQHPADRRRLIDEPELLDLATEEFLRVFPSADAHARTVMDDVEVGGVTMHRGDRLLVAWISVNRDEQVFDEPDQVRIDRFPNTHASFGLGAHRCLGSHLARMTFKQTIPQVLARMPDYEVRDDQLVRYPAGALAHGWSIAPAVFTPGARIGGGG